MRKDKKARVERVQELNECLTQDLVEKNIDSVDNKNITKFIWEIKKTHLNEDCKSIFAKKIAELLQKLTFLLPFIEISRNRRTCKQEALNLFQCFAEQVCLF